MSKKKGSAMIMAILLLSFFMALSLNMWFIAQKKAQRAGDKILGNQTLTEIDASSTLGYYELYLATQYMTNGFVTSPAGYTVTTASIDYTTGAAMTTIEGIQLPSQIEYFGNTIVTTAGFTTTANAILQSVNTGGNKRNWATSSGALGSLWWTSGSSIGGYTISSAKVGATSVISTTKNNFLTASYGASPTVGELKIVDTEYKKTVRFNGNSNITSASFIITVKRSTTLSYKTSAEFDIPADSIVEIVVERQN